MTDKSLDVDADKLGKFFDLYQMGSLLNSPSSGGPVAGQATPDAASWRYIMNQVQQIATTRGSKIPILFGLDTVHGANYIGGAALFPHQIGLAATFNRTHAAIAGANGARDTRYVGIPWVFSPILDLASVYPHYHQHDYIRPMDRSWR
jgi:beta-glucosidase